MNWGEFTERTLALSTTTVNIPRELVFIYHRDVGRVMIAFPGSDKRHRTRLCEIWADVIKGAVIADVTDGSPSYHLEKLKDRDFRFSADDGGNVIKACVVGINFSIEGRNGQNLSFSDTDGSIHDALDDYLNRENLPVELCHVQSAKIRVELAESFGRCRKQTLNIKTDSSDIEDKNVKVKDVLMDCLRRWGIFDA